MRERISRAYLFRGMVSGSAVFFVTTRISPSAMSEGRSLAASENRSPVKAQKQKTSRTLARCCRPPKSKL